MDSPNESFQFIVPVYSKQESKEKRGVLDNAFNILVIVSKS